MRLLHVLLFILGIVLILKGEAIVLWSGNNTFVVLLGIIKIAFGCLDIYMVLWKYANKRALIISRLMDITVLLDARSVIARLLNEWSECIMCYPEARSTLSFTMTAGAGLRGVCNYWIKTA